MSQPNAAPRRSSQPLAEEAVLVRYSPHHELPLSTATSVALHALAIGLLVIAGLVAAKLNWSGDSRGLPVSVVTMAEPGGGTPGRREGDAGSGAGAAPELPPGAGTRPENRAPERERLKEASQGGVLPEIAGPREDQRLIESSRATAEAWGQLSPEVRQKLARGLAPKGAPGRGNGPGPGSGDEAGPGGGNIDRRNRPLRWALVFNTRNGNDYLRQLEAFGAILAIPDPRHPDGYLVIRDLRRVPAEPQPEDIAKIERIFWIDDKPESVGSLSRALGLKAPPHFIVFFPAEFEAKLLRLELDYRGKREDEITETRFDVRLVKGSYEPCVVSQR
jgi:hypothetical protein